MQIATVEVTPVELKLRQPVQMAGLPLVEQLTAIFVRLETQNGLNAWGCAIAHPDLSGENPEEAIQACQACAQVVPDLHPTNLEYSLAELAPLFEGHPAAACAYDLAFHDLLGVIAGMPLYRLLGGYRNRIQTSVTIPIAPIQDSVDIARRRARAGFKMLKVKGGIDPETDVQRVKAVHRALPDHVLRLDADGSYTVQQALDVAHALETVLEMLEQPTPPDDLEGLRQVTRLSPVPILADQSVKGPSSALNLAAGRMVDGLCVKVGICGGLRCARQVETIARAAQIATLVSCTIEPALLISAGLSLALSSPSVHYGDLDGHLDLINDPTCPGFKIEDGWLVASDIPGLGCTVEL